MVVVPGDKAAIGPVELLFGKADANLQTAGRLRKIIEFEHVTIPGLRHTR
jgi:hypothetical protein